MDNPENHHLADQIFDMLVEFDPINDPSRRSQFLAERHRIRKERARLDAEKWAREERERLAALKRQEEEKERERREALREEFEAKRTTYLQNIRRQLKIDFLSADFIFRSLPPGFVTEPEYQEEKIAFVKSWMTEHTPTTQNGSRQSLDDEQSAAIAAVHGNVQVVARAGSGKTTTLVSRAFFLMKHCSVSPSEMLLLAFNRKAALEIRRRLLGLLNEDADNEVEIETHRKFDDVGKRDPLDKYEIEANAVDAVAARLKVGLPHVMTFHALAYAIVHPEESLLANGPEGEQQGLNRVFQNIIDDHLQIPEFRNRIREVMLAHFREDWERVIEGGHDKDRETFLRFRRSLPRQSMRGEYIKSYGEKLIADFLFEHDIDYKYERSHSWSGTNYRPDFTVFRASKSGVIIEYFGLEGDPDYDEMSADKRRYWETKPDWSLLEFSPQDITVGGVAAFLDSLKNSLESHDVKCIRLSEDEIWHRIKDRAIDHFTKAVANFVSRCRKKLISPLELLGLIDSYTPLSPVEGLFLDLAHRLYDAYLERLAAAGEEDFDGLMQRAADSIESGRTEFKRKSGSGDIRKLKYLFIDEFQDFSDLFYRMLNSVRNKNTGIELFCVGDDWQAINGFAGSDLKYFKDFGEYIRDSYQLYISTNYRSSDAIVGIGNALMNGLGKPAIATKSAGEVLVSDLSRFEPSLIEKERHSGDIVTPAVLRLISKALESGLDVVMLCRHNSVAPWYVSYPEQSHFGGRGLDRYLDLIRSFFPKGLEERISISTAHGFKGLEKPMVIVLDAVARSYPLIHPDSAFLRILGDSPHKIAEEERRLLYVALTRAIEKLVIITDGTSKSPFLEELSARVPLISIDWTNYSAARTTTTRLVVKIGNQVRRGGAPTFVLKDLLSANGYQWQSTGWPGWTKSFPSESFKIDNIKGELWTENADGVEVRILDDNDALTARYLIDTGRWECVMDEL